MRTSAGVAGAATVLRCYVTFGFILVSAEWIRRRVRLCARRYLDLMRIAGALPPGGGVPDAASRAPYRSSQATVLIR